VLGADGGCLNGTELATAAQVQQAAGRSCYQRTALPPLSSAGSSGTSAALAVLRPRDGAACYDVRARAQVKGGNGTAGLVRSGAEEVSEITCQLARSSPRCRHGSAASGGRLRAAFAKMYILATSAGAILVRIR